MAINVSRDGYGTTITIPEEPTVKTLGGQYRPGCPAVELWWSRDGKKADETIIIRQEYADRGTADVLELTQGQLYGLIEACNILMERT